MWRKELQSEPLFLGPADCRFELKLIVIAGQGEVQPRLIAWSDGGGHGDRHSPLADVVGTTMCCQHACPDNGDWNLDRAAEVAAPFSND